MPWVHTAGADFVATELGRTDFRDLAHWRLAPVRLRYGVPRNDMCELVRDGFDRDDAIAVVEEFEKVPVGAQFMGLKAYSEQWRRARVKQSLKLRSTTNRYDSSGVIAIIWEGFSQIK